MASSVREARQALVNVVNDDTVPLGDDDRADLFYAIGLLDDYLEDED
jgi:hypothetical protein